MLEYKAATEGITVTLTSERDTSKSCSVCGRTDDTQHLTRRLYVCVCGFVGNADCKSPDCIRLAHESGALVSQPKRAAFW